MTAERRSGRAAQGITTQIRYDGYCELDWLDGRNGRRASGSIGTDACAATATARTNMRARCVGLTHEASGVSNHLRASASDAVTSVNTCGA